MINYIKENINIVTLIVSLIMCVLTYVISSERANAVQEKQIEMLFSRLDKTDSKLDWIIDKLMDRHNAKI